MVTTASLKMKADEFAPLYEKLNQSPLCRSQKGFSVYVLFFFLFYRNTKILLGQNMFAILLEYNNANYDKYHAG